MPPRRSGTGISRVEYGRLKGAWHQARQQNLGSGKHFSQPSFSVKPSFNARPSWARKTATRTLGSARRKWMAKRQERLDNPQRGNFESSIDVRAGARFGDPKRMFKSSYRGTPRPDYSWGALKKRFGIRSARPELSDVQKKYGDTVGPGSRRSRAFEMLGAGGGI